MIEIKKIKKVFNPGTVNSNLAINNVSLTLNDGDNSWLWSSFCWVWGPQCWWCHQKPTWSYWDSVKHYFDSLGTWLCQIPLQRMSDRLLRNNSMWAFGSAWENTYQKFLGISFSPNLNNLFLIILILN